MRKLDGKIAIVTGGARGLGAGAVIAMCEEGASVLIADVIECDVATQEAIEKYGHKVKLIKLDVTKESDWKEAVAYAVQEFGGVDILLNNAGINIPISFEDASHEQFKTVLDVNLSGPFLGMKAVLPAMKKRGGGSIVNVSSNSTHMIIGLTSLYSASKSALANLTKTSAYHCAKNGYNIRINSIHPGPHATNMLLGGEGQDANLTLPGVKELVDAIPMGRMGRPDEFGKVVAFLASDESCYMTGTEIFCDGGLTFAAAGVP